MQAMWRRINQFFSTDIWTIDLSKCPRYKVVLIKALRLLYAIHREFSSGELTLPAMGLVYTTLLSLVPLLAVSFSVLKAFGVHNQIEPLLLNFLEPMGEKGLEITTNVINFVENIKVGVLGSVGLALLFYTVISLLHKIEHTFNAIWHETRPRSIGRRFSDYLSVVLIGPVLIFSGLGLTASMVSTAFVQKLIAIEPFGTAFYLAGQLVPYLLIIAAFTFVYLFVPNTKVKISAALFGGTVGGILWKTAGWAFALFAASSTNYDAIYSSFAIVILFMIWIYVSWLILLLGAQLSFYFQNPQFIRVGNKRPRLSVRITERLGLLIMRTIASNYYQGKNPQPIDGLAQALDVPSDFIAEIIEILKQHGLLIETNDDPPAYVPGRALDTILLADVIKALRRAHDDDIGVDPVHLSTPGVDQVVADLSEALLSTLSDRTLRELIDDKPST